MKRLLVGLVAAFLLCPGMQALPGSAAEPVSPDVQVITPLYPLERMDAGLLSVQAPAGERVSVRVLQTSEERDSLLLYEMTHTVSTETTFVFVLEPGNYMVDLQMPTVRDGFTMQSAMIPVTIANPDYATTITQECYAVALARDTDASTQWQYRRSEPQQTETDGIQTTAETITFFCHAGMLGDLDGDEVITATDATMVLQYYVQNLAGAPTDWDARQLALADTNADGICNVKDATMILQYYTAGLTGKTITWSSLQAENGKK